MFSVHRPTLAMTCDLPSSLYPEKKKKKGEKTIMMFQMQSQFAFDMDFGFQQGLAESVARGRVKE
jgi:hypothetical protein